MEVLVFKPSQKLKQFFKSKQNKPPGFDDVLGVLVIVYENKTNTTYDYSLASEMFSLWIDQNPSPLQII